MIKADLFSLFDKKFDLNSDDLAVKIDLARKKLYAYDEDIMKKHGNFQDRSGLCVKSVDGIAYSCLWIKGSTHALTVIFDGAKPEGYNYYKQPNFPRWSYYNLLEGCLLGIDDPMYLCYPDLKLGWYYGTIDTCYIGGCLKIIKEVCSTNAIPYNKITFFSSSGGGYAALLASILLPGTTSLSINPQLCLDRHSNSPHFKQVTGINLKKYDALLRNDLPTLMKQSRSRHVILVNAASKSDVVTQLAPFLKDISGELRYGLNQFNNILVWIYDCPGVPDAHSSYETKYIYCVIDYITQKFASEEDFDIGHYQKIAILVNEAWHDIYMRQEKIYRNKKRILQNVIILKDKNICNFMLERKYEKINLKASNNAYNFYLIDEFQLGYAYKVVISGTRSASTQKITYGLYDRQNMVKVCFKEAKVCDTIELSFLITTDASHICFCIYAGICGYCENVELYIDAVRIYSVKMISK